MTREGLRVMIVDDTIVYRTILRGIMEASASVSAIDTASNGKLALDKLARQPADLVLLDVEMPVMDGLQTLEHIRKSYPETGVIMVSGTNKRAADTTVKALELGALDFVRKPEGTNQEESRTLLANPLDGLIRTFITQRNLRKARAPRVRPGAPPTPRPSGPPTAGGAPAPPVAARRQGAKPTRVEIVVVGVSTGGPKALAQVVPKFPKDLGVPVLVVQHMPPVFTASLADNLSRQSVLPVTEGKDGEVLEPNHVYIAPGGLHMVLRKGAGAGNTHRLGVTDSPPVNNCRPSVDVLFRSVAVQYRGNILSVMMTGMGADGRDGVRALKGSGCYSLSQSADTCVVYGMPQAVDAAGLTDEQVALGELGERIVSLVKRGDFK